MSRKKISARALPNERCEKCRTEYTVTASDGARNVFGQFKCRCGHLIRAWNGATAYSYIHVPDRKSKKAK
jgi:hypothetical protein